MYRQANVLQESLIFSRDISGLRRNSRLDRRLAGSPAWIRWSQPHQHLAGGLEVNRKCRAMLRGDVNMPELALERVGCVDRVGARRVEN
jgi:hypothetical protein